MRLKELKCYRIYGLSFPKNKKIFYIGSTSQPLAFRLTQHLSETRSGHGGQRKFRILKRLLGAKKRPGIVELDRCGPKEWEAKEREWIARFRRAGYKLTNTADGGRGQFGTHHTAEVRRKIAASVSRTRQAQRNINIPS
jgi:hypothetical protein